MCSLYFVLNISCVYILHVYAQIYMYIKILYLYIKYINLKIRLCYTYYTILWCFLHISVGKESACNARDPSSIPELGRSPGEGNGNTL